ncbi:hypothetical protein BX070DRAFT_229683 [Coemansia spiralis]|nr:hypothetical protein BX070DRAFT_229683 [Coemansia spiralis]
MSIVNFAGLLIYRISPRKPIEYLLLNDSYEHHRHWYPPKGRLIGNEDELKCALRETIDLTGLSTSDLVLDEAFRAELRYVDGIKPKQVVYFLARLAVPARHGLIRCDGAGMKHQWCPLDQALDKAVFQSMQDILTQAEDYIEGMRDEILPSNQRNRWQTVGDDSGRGVRSSASGSRQYDDVSGGDATANGKGDDSTGTWRMARGGSSGIEGRFKRMALADNNQRSSGRGSGERDQQSFSSNHRDQQQQPGNGNFQDNADGTQQRRPQDNPRYKTKLCEKFEQDGVCPYGQKCVFAHGMSELRVRESTAPISSNVVRGGVDDRAREYANSSSSSPYNHHHQQQQQQQQQQSFEQRSPVAQSNAGQRYNSNPLYKTRLCQRFSEDGGCPYGEKCQFAHGESELRVNPEQPPQPRTPRDGQFPPRTPTADQNQGGFNRMASSQTPSAWRRGGGPLESIGERLQAPRMPRNLSWSNTGARRVGEPPSFSDDGSMDSPGYPSANLSPKSPAIVGDIEFKGPQAAPLITPIAQKIPAPVAASNVTNSNENGSAAKGGAGPASAASAKRSQESRSGSGAKAEAAGNKPWIKVVEVSDRDLKEMGSPLADTGSIEIIKSKPVSKTAELESRLAKELIDFFGKSTANGQEPTLQTSFKEITHMEFRNNLTKQQLLNIVIAALFGPCSAKGVSEAIEKSSDLLSKIVSKQQDQVFMLNAWQRLLTDDESAALWQRKASELLGALYKESLLDEEVFTQWFASKNTEDCGPAVASMKPFANWLATAEEE